MSPFAGDLTQDVMQVCLNGHVITDLAGAHPERRRTACDRCGAATIDRCPTCGTALPGAVPVPGLAPVGTRRPPPCCSVCGAALPWNRHSAPAGPVALVELERLLRRLPRAVRELRWRQGDRPPFRVEDETDLEDLLRAILPLHFDSVRPERRTPHYAAAGRTDFLLAAERIAVAVKLSRPPLTSAALAEQLQEDAAHYRGRADCRALVVFLYDPEGKVPDPRAMEAAGSLREGGWELRCVVGTAEAAYAPAAGAG